MSRLAFRLAYRAALRSALLAGLWFAALPLAGGAQSRPPPQPIAQILDQPATPLVQLSPDREQLLLLERPGLPPVADWIGTSALPGSA
jgi:hypothetical protein